MFQRKKMSKETITERPVQLNIDQLYTNNDQLSVDTIISGVYVHRQRCLGCLATTTSIIQIGLGSNTRRGQKRLIVNSSNILRKFCERTFIKWKGWTLVDKCSSMAFGAIHGRRIYLFHICHSLLNTLAMKKLEKNLSLDKTLIVLCKLFLDLVFSNKL